MPVNRPGFGGPPLQQGGPIMAPGGPQRFQGPAGGQPPVQGGPAFRPNPMSGGAVPRPAPAGPMQPGAMPRGPLMGSYKRGTGKGKVPKTGAYKLHKGEKVLTAKQAKLAPVALLLRAKKG